MKYLFALLLMPLALAACSKEGSGNEAMPNAAPVAAVAPPAGQSWATTVTETAQGYMLGNPNAPIKLVEYGDRLCPACKALATTGYKPLIDNYVSTGKVSFEFRDFLIHGPPALALAAVGRCAGKEPFFAILEQNYANQDPMNEKLVQMTPQQQQALTGGAPAKVITGWAEQIGAIDFIKQRGVPEAKARQCLADEALLNKIADVADQAAQNGTVTGTPTLIVNGRKIDGITWPDLEAALKRAGA